MKQVILEGKNMTTMKDFYNEVELKMTKELGWEIGRNLNAFNDVLWGGFGVYEYEEKIILVIKDSDYFRKAINKDRVSFDVLIEIIMDHKNHIDLVLS